MQNYIKRQDYAKTYVHYARTINTYLESMDYFFSIAEKQAGFLNLNDMEPEKRVEALFRYAGKYFADMQKLAHDAALALVKLAVEDEQHDSKISLDNLREMSRINANVLGSFITASAKYSNKEFTPDRITTAQANFLSLSSATVNRCTGLLYKCGAYKPEKPATYRSSRDWSYRLQTNKFNNSIPLL